MAPDSLMRVTEIATSALEAEDRSWLGAVSSNPAYSQGAKVPNVPVGLLGKGILNERYFQFVVARALVSALPYRVHPELNSHDLVLLENEKTWFAIIEMKCYISATGSREAVLIRDDARKLLRIKRHEVKHRWMLVFAGYPREPHEENLREQNLNDIERFIRRGGACCPVSAYGCFHTYDQCGRSAEFLVAGFEVEAEVQDLVLS